MHRLAALILLAAALGCGGKKSDDAKPATAPPAAKPVEPAAKPAEPPPPPAPVYSPETAKALVAEMIKCSSDYGCQALDTLVGFGAPAAAELLALAGDTAATTDARGLAASALTKLKASEAGPKLVEIANAIADDRMLQGDLYEAAGASGGQGTFDALIAEYAKARASSDDDREIPLRQGLKAFPAQSVAWAKDNLPKAAKDNQVPEADLITDSATAADLPVVVELLAAAKDPMARHRLAAKAIELGDTSHFGVFVAGLSSKDEYDRSDAANFLENVADKAPAELKDKLIELLEAGKAGDRGGLTSMGYDGALKKLRP
jgi:hypothetical protein